MSNSNTFVVFVEESEGEKRGGFEPDSVPQPSKRCQNVYGDLRDNAATSNARSGVVDTSQRFPKFDSKLGKKSLFYGWASLRDVLDMEGPMKRQVLAHAMFALTDCRNHRINPKWTRESSDPSKNLVLKL